MTKNKQKSGSLLVGAAGQVGRQLFDTIGKHRCIPTARHAPSADWISLDLATLDRDTALRLLEPVELDAIYCVGGMTNVELCESEQDLAMRTNCKGPSILASIANERRVPFIYFSTEYVFDGISGPYVEGSPTNPISVYGNSKLQGELAVMAACDESLIIRTTVVYGHDPAKKNFLQGLRRALLAGDPFRVPLDQISTPTYNCDLANATLRLVESGAHGIYHVCGPEVLSRFDFAMQAAKIWQLSTENLIGVPTRDLNQVAPRPLRAGLLTEKLCNEHPGIHMRTLKEALSHWEEQWPL